METNMELILAIIIGALVFGLAALELLLAIVGAVLEACFFAWTENRAAARR